MNHRGEWIKIKKGTAVLEVYEKGDIVVKGGVSYIALKQVNGKIDPAGSSEITYEPLRHWDLFGGRPTKIDGGFF
jgi:hypothetical protein